jgi:hypothetical protein
MHMHREEPLQTIGVVDPVSVEVLAYEGGERVRHIWISRRDFHADKAWPGNTVRLKYDKFLTFQSYSEERDELVAIERALGYPVGVKGVIPWTCATARDAKFLWPRSGGVVETVMGYIAPRMECVTGRMYDFVGLGQFVCTGDAIFVAQKESRL